MISLNHVLWFILFLTTCTKCSLFHPIESKDKDNTSNDNEIQTPSPGTSLEESSSKSTSELTVITYRILMDRLKLKNIHNSIIPFNLYDSPAESKYLARLIGRNFCEAYFYGLNERFRRFGYSDKLRREDRYNGNVLYNLVQDREALNVLGYYFCLVIIVEIIKQFQNYINFSCPTLKIVFESIAIQLTDFLEFIVSKLIPKYSISKTDSEYNLQDHCEVEYPAFVDIAGFIDVGLVAKFKNVDFLRIFVDRFSQILPRSATEVIISDALRLLGTSEFNLFKEVFTLMVRQSPDFFLHPAQVSNYISGPIQPNSHISHFMFVMAPILRALMILDREDVTERYLERYRTAEMRAMFSDNGASTLKVLNYFIHDSKFAIVPSEEVFERKKEILAFIFKFFFDIEATNYFTIAYYCVSLNFLPLYEVFLQFFSEEFDQSNRKLLVLRIIDDLSIKKSVLAAGITLGYLEFENFESILQEAESKVKWSLCLLEARQRKIRRIRAFKEIWDLLKDCPLKQVSGYLVERNFVPVPWPCPSAIQISFSVGDPGLFPKLFYYSQAVLCKRFKIPFHNVSNFESTMNETATWSEMIGFINLHIEKMISLVGFEGERPFKFRDTTDYPASTMKIGNIK